MEEGITKLELAKPILEAKLSEAVAVDISLDPFKLTSGRASRPMAKRMAQPSGAQSLADIEADSTGDRTQCLASGEPVSPFGDTVAHMS